SASMAHAGLLVTDGAEPVEVAHPEVELNGTYTIDKAKSGGVTAKCHSTDGDVTLTAGVYPGGDLSVGLPYTFVTREKIKGGVTSRIDGLNDMTVDVKYRFFDRDGFKLAIKPGLIIPTGRDSEGLSDGRTGVTAALLATKEIADGKVALHANAGYERHNYEDRDVDATSRADIFSFSVAAETEVAAGLKLALDAGLSTNSEKGHSTPPVYILCGGVYEMTKNLEIYAGIKVGVTETEDNFAGLAGLKYKL
ncbi:MAG TPA: transporter, partial [Geobacteraceae bacterium]|nr:transporter [Geobacteraceae bacterium]